MCPISSTGVQSTVWHAGHCSNLLGVLGIFASTQDVINCTTGDERNYYKDLYVDQPQMSIVVQNLLIALLWEVYDRYLSACDEKLSKYGQTGSGGQDNRIT